MSSDPKHILSEFGIDVNGKDPDGQYQWKLLSLRAGSEERKRLEKAWSAFVLDRKEVDLPQRKVLETGTAKQAAANAPERLRRFTSKRFYVLLGFAFVAVGAGIWFLLEHSGESGTHTPGAWQAKYEALKDMVDESAHDDEHHEEFILLAEAAKDAIRAGQGALLLDRMNADLAAERAGHGTQRISTLAAHKAQWQVIVQALVMNKVELLEHEEFKGHHEGEL